MKFERRSEKEYDTLKVVGRELFVLSSTVQVGERELLAVSPIRLTPKNKTGFRLIVNMRRVNKTLPPMTFKMEGLSTVLQLIPGGRDEPRNQVAKRIWTHDTAQAQQEHQSGLHETGMETAPMSGWGPGAKEDQK